jgi:hypothetical protein
MWQSYTGNTILAHLKQKMKYTVKSSLMISHVSVEWISSVSRTVLASIVRDWSDEWCSCSLSVYTYTCTQNLVFLFMSRPVGNRICKEHAHHKFLYPGPERGEMEPRPVTYTGLPPHSKSHINIWIYLINTVEWRLSELPSNQITTTKKCVC